MSDGVATIEHGLAPHVSRLTARMNSARAPKPVNYKVGTDFEQL
jgi:hypothetical protein